MRIISAGGALQWRDLLVAMTRHWSGASPAMTVLAWP